MPELPPPTLAANGILELLFFLFIVGAWIIGSIVKNRQEQGEADTGSAGDDAPQGEEVRKRLRELAEQRRRQLEEMARNKEQPAGSGSGSGGGRGGGGGPATASTGRPQTSSGESTSSEPYRPVDPHRRQPQATREQQQQPQRQQQEERQRRQREQRERRRQQQQQEKQEELERQRRLAEKAKKADPIQQGEMGKTGKRKGPAGATSQKQRAPKQRAALGSLQVDPQSLRQGIILKELLDKPVGMRDPAENHLNW